MVYVGTRKYRLGRMMMSHMVADSYEELMEMVDNIGVNRNHYQKWSSIPHFDICQEKKQLAIEIGATLVSDKEIIKMFRK